MKMPRRAGKAVTIAVLLIAFICVLFNFDNIFKSLNCNALSISDNTKSEITNIPNNINFLNSDKNDFVNYCKEIYGDNLPLAVDSSSYVYYGTVNGYRFYHMQCLYIPYENMNCQVNIDGFTFESSIHCRPEPTGLYIIGNGKVFTLSEAYDNGIVNIAKIYKLYYQARELNLKI